MQSKINFKAEKGKRYMLEIVSDGMQTVFLTDDAEEADRFFERMKNSGYDIENIDGNRIWTMELNVNGLVLIMSEANDGTLVLNGKQYDLKNVRRMTLHNFKEKWIEIEFRKEAPGYGKTVRCPIYVQKQYNELSDFLEDGGRADIGLKSCD